MELTIIIPIYNGIKYIKRCLDGIIPQLKENMEILFIDDGSTDGSSEVCDKYAAMYNFIRVIHQKNGGIGSARNVGIRNADGIYLTFIDIDDEVADKFCEKLYENIIDSVDVVVFEHINQREEKLRHEYGVIELSANDREKLIKNTYNATTIASKWNINMCSVWGKMFRKEFLLQNKIIVPERLKIAEDMLFMLQVYSLVNTVRFVGYPIYIYYINADSISNRYKPDSLDINSRYNEISSEWIEKNPQYKKYHINNRLNGMIMHLKCNFFHEENIMPMKEKGKLLNEFIEMNQYKECYIESKRNGLLQQYSLGKRILFWLVIHHRYKLADTLIKIKYS